MEQQTLTDGQVYGGRVPVKRQRPHMQTVHAAYAVNVSQITSQVVVFDAARHALHEDVSRITNDAERRGQHQEGEEERADWIRQSKMGLSMFKSKFPINLMLL